MSWSELCPFRNSFGRLPHRCTPVVPPSSINWRPRICQAFTAVESFQIGRHIPQNMSPHESFEKVVEIARRTTGGEFHWANGHQSRTLRHNSRTISPLLFFLKSAIAQLVPDIDCDQLRRRKDSIYSALRFSIHSSPRKISSIYAQPENSLPIAVSISHRSTSGSASRGGGE